MVGEPAGPSGSWGDVGRKLGAASGPDRVVLIAGALLLLDGFLPWYQVGPFSRSGFSSGTLAILSVACGAGAAAWVAARLLGARIEIPIPHEQVTKWLARAAALFLAWRFINIPSFLGFGFYIAAGCAIALPWAAAQPRAGALRVPSPTQLLSLARSGIGPGVIGGAGAAGALMWIPSHSAATVIGSSLAMIVVVGGLRLADPALVPLWRKMLVIPQPVRYVIGIGVPVLLSMRRFGPGASGQEITVARSALLMSAVIAYVFMRPRESDR